MSDPQTKAFNVMMTHVRQCDTCSKNANGPASKWCSLGKGFYREYAKAGRQK